MQSKKIKNIYFGSKLCLFASVLGFAFLFACIGVQQAGAQSVNASRLVPRVEISLSPSTGSFVEGSTFEVPILINTKGQSINGIEIRLNFDKNKLSIVQPSSGTSIIGVWVQPPTYDNTRGTANYIGVVPSGITTASGLIGTITFKAKSTGSAAVTIDQRSKVLLNDGLGTEAALDVSRGSYSILPKAPEGAVVFSETHPFQDRWYNNNSPVISWERSPDADGYSIVLDNKPFTIPESKITTTEGTYAYENLDDGLWYFHIKTNKNKVWGATTHFLMRIDTTPPAEFRPEVNYLLAAVAIVRRSLVSFFTTDNLSGIDHYEVGVIDKSQPTSVSPVFIETESPYQVPVTYGKDMEVIVRAIDMAGNVRDESVSVTPPLAATQFIKDYLVYILAGIILLGLVMIIIHYLVGHHIIRHLRRVRALLKKEEAADLAAEAQEQVQTEAHTESPAEVQKANAYETQHSTNSQNTEVYMPPQPPVAHNQNIPNNTNPENPDIGKFN